jgi:hypothetical protein
MTRALRTIVLSLFALLAAYAVVAPGASAAKLHHFTTAGLETTLTAQALEAQVFGFGAGEELVCQKVQLTGAINGEIVTEITVEPKLEIQVTVFGANRPCIDVPGEQLFSGVHYAQGTYKVGETSYTDIQIKPTIGNIEAETTEDPFAKCGNGAMANATYSGLITLKGDKPAVLSPTSIGLLTT